MADEGAAGPVLYTDGRRFSYKEHEAIIQTLDRTDQYGTYLDQEMFAPTVDAWDGIPLIFSQEHPDPEAFDKDPEAELRRIGGRMVNGTNRDTRIDTVGHPTLRTTFDLDDEEISEGIAAGEISTSNCFFLRQVDGRTVVHPHHILFFRETEKDVPGDRGVLILNKERKDLTLKDRLRALVGRRTERKYQEETDMADEALRELLATARQDLAKAQETIAQLQTALGEEKAAGEEKDKEIEALKSENKQYKEKAADERWSAFKGKYIPPGLVAGDKEAALRKEFESAPEAVFEKILAYKDEEEGDGEEPVQYTSGKAKKKVSVADELAALGVPSLSYSRGGEQ